MPVRRAPAAHSLAAAIIGLAIGVSWTCLRNGMGARARHDPGSDDPDMAGALEPFSPAVLRRRVLEVFPAGYLTLTAIIQGVALGAAVITTSQQHLGHGGIIRGIVVVGQAAWVFAAVVIITHRYFMLTVTARWTPTILDTLIPYGLGVGETTTALLIGQDTAWWIAVAGLSLVAVGALGHTYFRATRPSFAVGVRGSSSLKTLGIRMSSLKTRIVCCLGLAGYSATAAVLSARSIGPKWMYLVLLGIALAGAVVVAIVGERSQNRLYDALGIPRWRNPVGRER